MFALLFAAACSDDGFEAFQGDLDRLVATPTQMFLEVGETKTVEVSGLDQQGNPLTFAFEAAEQNSSIIDVTRDSTFLPIYVDDTTLAVPAQGERFRFLVEGLAYGSTSFTVSAGGQDVTIPVQVIPRTAIAATFDNAQPALGDTTTLTAAAGTHFTPTAALVIGTDTLTIVDRAPDGTSIRFIAPPTVNSPVTITEVTADATPGLVFSPATETPLVSPLIDTVDVVYSTAAPTVGQTVTVTIQEPLINFVVDSIIFPGTLPGPASSAANVVVAPDSGSLTFEAPPNGDGVGTFVNFVFPGGYRRALPTRTGITVSPNVGTVIAATYDDDTPALLQVLTLTAPAGFGFAPDVVVNIGGNDALIQSVAPDGNSLQLIPIPGSSGVSEITGVTLDAAPQFEVTMSNTQSLSVPAITPLEGTEDTATAPALTVPTAGNSTVVNDGGAFDGSGACCFGGHERLYKITIAAPTTLTFTVDWFEGQDLGVYIMPEGFVDDGDIIDAGDSAGEGAAGHPESVTVALAPGTYFVAIPNFSATNPSFFQLTISNP